MLTGSATVKLSDAKYLAGIVGVLRGVEGYQGEERGEERGEVRVLPGIVISLNPGLAPVLDGLVEGSPRQPIVKSLPKSERKIG